MRTRPNPNDLVPVVLLPEHFVYNEADQTGYPPITMHIYTPILTKQIPHQHEPFVDHGDKAVRALAPSVTVGYLFQDIGLFGKGVAADLYVRAEIRSHIKWRVNVNQLEATLLFNLLAQRAVL